MVSSYVVTSNRNNSNRMAKQLGSLSYGATASDIRICTFNCRSLENSIIDIKNLCDTRDIVLLQEHWLIPFELGILSEISNEFLAFGLSAVDVSSGIIKGRPYGGTAVLYRKQLARFINLVNSCEPRLSE